MKSRVIGVCLCIMLLISGCGLSKPALEDAADEQLSVTVTPEPEIIIKEVEVVKEVEVIKEKILEVTETIVEDDTIDSISNVKDSFLATVEGQYEEVVYLGHPKKIDILSEEIVKWYSKDMNIATVSNGFIEGHDEGITEIWGANEAGDVISSYKIAVTTFNDGQEKNYMPIMNHINDILSYSEASLIHQSCDPQVAKDYCNTIYDFAYWLSEQRAYYDGSFPIVVNNLWTWALPGDAMLLSNKGVCCDVANAAAYVLNHDYEDMGFIMVCGMMGHIYNWFYEDGTYYVFDYTRTIADGWNPNNAKTEATKLIKEFTDLEELKAYVNRSIPEDTLYIGMYSSMGHDFQCAVHMSYMQDSSQIPTGHSVIGFEECVFKNMYTLYEHPTYDFEVISVPTDQIPAAVPTYGERIEKEEKFGYYPY